MTDSTSSIRRALFIHDQGIGDFLIALRLIDVFEAHFRNYRWDYLGKPKLGRLASALGTIAHYEDFSRLGWHILFTENETVEPSIENYFKNFSLIVNAATGANTIFAYRLDQLRRPSSTLYHIDTKPQTIKKHYFHQLAEQLNFYQPSELPATSFNVDESLISKISLEIPKLSSTCFIHPGASSRNKRLPLEFFVKHAEKSASEGLSPCFLLGEAEREQFSSSEIDTLKKYGNLLVNFPLENLAAMFSLCHHYIGNDNGISHLAGCVGADTTIFFHTTDPVLWRPMGPKITVKRLKDEH